MVLPICELEFFTGQAFFNLQDQQDQLPWFTAQPSVSQDTPGGWLSEVLRVFPSSPTPPQCKMGFQRRPLPLCS